MNLNYNRFIFLTSFLLLIYSLNGQKTVGSKNPPPPPPPPPPPVFELNIEEIGDVEKDVTLPGCEASMSKEEKAKCEIKRMLEFVYANLECPQEAIDKKISGMVVVQFVIEKDGSVHSAKVLKDIGGGCGEAVKKVVEKLKFPALNRQDHMGRARGRPVKTQFTLPIRFDLTMDYYKFINKN